jgi:hypothetical protein
LSEKPSVAREIANIVGATDREDGYIHGNGYMVTWALGHLVGLAMPEDYGFRGFVRENLPIIPETFILKPRQIKDGKEDKPAPMGGQLSGLPVLQIPVTQAQGKGGFDPFVKGVHSPACTCGCTPHLSPQGKVAGLKWDNRPSVNPDKWSVENAFKGYSKGLQNAVEMTFAKEITEGKTLLPDMLKANVSRFSAAKAVTCDRLLQQDAAKEPDRQTGASNMVRTFDYWQQTEENTARTRARTAKQWQEFTEGDRAEVLPNIKWLRSVAIDKRPEHEVFAGRIWAKDDPFWETNMYGQQN